jgi:hypothetical protein
MFDHTAISSNHLPFTATTSTPQRSELQGSWLANSRAAHHDIGHGPLGDAQCITLGALTGDHDVSGARVRFME